MFNFKNESLTRRRAVSGLFGIVLGGFALASTLSAHAEAPKVGDTAPDFTLNDLKDKKVSLASQLKKGKVVLVMLRGYPGYQCPLCTAQVNSFLGKAQGFTDAKAQVILVYPGISDGLKAHAEEFTSGKDIPANFHFLIDPDYTFTKRYDLRWDAPHETAYPATFVLNQKGKIVFEKISHSHGDRADVGDVLQALGK